MTHRLKTPVYFVFLLVTASVLGSCGSSDPVTIGLSIDLSGTNSEKGQAVRDGAMMAVEMANAGGGINGRPIALRAVDDLGTVQGAKDSVSTLTGSAVIIGNYTSTQTLASYPIAEAAKTVLISSSASTSALSKKDDYFFRTAVATDVEARAFAKHVATSLRRGLVMIVRDTDNPGFTEDFARVFNEQLQKSGMENRTPIEFSSSGRGDFEFLVSKVVAEKPIGILLLANANDSAILSQVIKRAQPGVMLFGSPWSQGNGLIQNGGRSVEGMTLLMPSDSTQRNENLDAFYKSYENRFGWKPIYSAAEGFDLTKLLIQALRASSSNGTDLRTELRRIKPFQTMDGAFVSFDAYGDVVRNMYIVVVKDGEFVTTATLTMDF